MRTSLMALPLRPSRLVALVLLPVLSVAALLADRALVRARDAERLRAESERVERAHQAGLALRAEIAAVERDAAEGRPRDGVLSWRVALPLDPRLSSRPSGLDGRDRNELVILAASTDVTPGGLPAAVPAALALGEDRVKSDVRDRLLEGRLPVSPDDLPALAAALGAADDPRLAPLVERLRSVPPRSSLPRVPAFLRHSREGLLEGWSRDRADAIHWEWDPRPWLATAGARPASASAPGAAPVEGIEGLALETEVDLAGVTRAAWLRRLAAALFVLLALVVAAASVVLAREERAVARERDFLATVTHELRTPVTAVRLLGETLAEGRGSPADYGALIAAEGRRLEGLVERGLLAARTEGRLVPAPLDVAGLLASVVRLAEPAAARQGKRVGLEIREPLPEASWDGESIRQAVTNLVDNALKHGGSDVRVEARVDGEHARVIVRDDGPGIRRRDRSRVFGRFLRGDSAAAGTGLGLWLVEQVARAHGGRVELESEEGRGCAFTLVLPLRADAGVTS